MNVLEQLNSFDRQISMLLAAHESGRQESLNDLKKFEVTLSEYDDSGLTSDEKRVFADVRKMFAANVEKLQHQLTADLIFLNDQKSAIEEVKTLNDEKKRKELTDMLVEDFGDAITDFKEFQKELDAQSDEDRKFLQSIIEDLTHMLNEGGFKELEAIMADFSDASEGDEDVLECSDEDCDDEDCESDCDLSDDDLASIKEAFLKINHPYLHNDDENDNKDSKEDIN